jgi:hypothetical protein
MPEAPESRWIPGGRLPFFGLPAALPSAPVLALAAGFDYIFSSIPSLSAFDG